jgi:hypothetical protein
LKNINWLILTAAIMALLTTGNTAYGVYPYTNTYTSSNGITTDGTILPEHINTSNTEHINNNIPESIDDFSANTTEMRSTRDPYPASVISLSLTLDDELEAMRWQLLGITAGTFWYEDAPTYMTDRLATDFDFGTNSYTLGGAITLDVAGSGIGTDGSINFGTNTYSLWSDGTDGFGTSTGDISMNATGNDHIFQSAAVTQATIDDTGIDIITGNEYMINATSVLNATTLGTGVLASSLTSVGTLASPVMTTPTLGVASATSLATSAATPLLLTNGQLVNIALTAQTAGATTLTIPDFASVVDEFVFKTKAVTMSNKTFIAPILGTPASGVMTNVTGTAAGLTAGNVTTNANLTGPVTSVGNATAIADKALAIAKLADGTDGELITWDASGVIAVVAAGTSAQVLTSNGAGAAPTFQASSASGITLATPQASTSGTAIDFTSIPSGTKRITIMFAAVSTDGTQKYIVQLGDSGGIETTGYKSVCNTHTTTVAETTGMVLFPSTAAAQIYSGTAVLTVEDTSDFTWISSSSYGDEDSPGAFGFGRKSLTAELDRVRITSVSSPDTFDAGEINISYE